MPTFTRLPEFVNPKKIKFLLMKVNQKHLILAKDKEDPWDNTPTLKRIYDKQRAGSFNPMYKNPDKFSGRAICKTGYAALSRKVRNWLADEFYFDIDMQNSIYMLMTSWAELHNLPTDHLRNYINNRSEILENLMGEKGINKEEAKKIYTKKWFIDQTKATKGISGEIGNIQRAILDEDNTTAIINIVGTDTYNWIGKVTSRYYFQQEWLVLEKSMDFLKAKGFHICADLHDGFFCKKEGDNVSIFRDKVNDALQELNLFISQETKLNVHFIIKDMTDTLDLDFCDIENKDQKETWQDDEVYKGLKTEFEKTVCKITNHGKFIQENKYNGSFIIKSKNELQTTFEDYSLDTFYHISNGANFINSWLKDPTKRKYDDMDFIPDHTKCPANIYNTYKTFRILELDAECDNNFSQQDNKDYDLIMDHFKYITDDGTEMAETTCKYVLDWIAHIFKYPTQKTNTALIFKSGQGTGKSIICKFIGYLLGDNYFYATADPEKEVFGSFNSVVANKMLINFDEAEKKETDKFYEKFKNLITEDKITYKEKFVKESIISNYARYILTTNNAFSIKIDATNRRFVPIECIHPRKDMVEFKKYIDAFENPKAQVLFFRMLMDRDIHYNKWDDIPKCKSYLNAMCATADKVYDFLDNIVTDAYGFQNYKGHRSISITSLYKMYEDWANKENVKCERRKEFKNALIETKLFNQTRTTKVKCLVYFDLDNLKDKLVSMGYEKYPDFIAETDDEEGFGLD